MTKVYITESGYKLNVASTLRMTASEAETLLDGVFEPVLGNPGTNGYVLSSTTAGVRSWVAQSGGGGGDVGDLTTTTGSSTNMLRVAAAGGLEYRTTAQVLGDIGAAPKASPTFTGTVTLPTTVASVIKPAADSTTALRLANAAGTTVMAIDTTNKKVIVSDGSIRSATLQQVFGGNFQIDTSTGGVEILTVGTLKWKVGASTNAYFINTGLGVGTTASVSDNNLAVAGKSTFGHVASPTASADIAASTTAAASLRIRSGTAPTTPNDGDIYYDGSNLLVYVSSAWYTLDKTAV